MLEMYINLWKAILYNHNRVFNITQLNENKYINDDFKIFNKLFVKKFINKYFYKWHNLFTPFSLSCRGQ